MTSAAPLSRLRLQLRPGLRLLVTEISIHLRSGLYGAYAVMTAFFLLLLVLTPPEFRERGFELIVLLDPGFMGFFFAAGLVLLERDQGVIAVVATHGRGFRSWWSGKVFALGVLAGTVVAALTAIAHGAGLVSITTRGIGVLTMGLILSLPVYFSLGVVLVSRFPRVLDYFIYAGIVMLPFMFPLVELAGVPVGPVGVISPVWGGLVLLSSVFEPVRGAPETGMAVVSLIVWNVVAYRWAQRVFARLVTGHRRGPSVPSQVASRAGRSQRRELRRGPALRFGPGRADVTLLLRDPVARLILVAPFAAAAVLGRGLPILGERFSLLAPVIQQFMDPVRSFAILLTALMYGMLGGFLILDEKDEGLLSVLMTMPDRRGWHVIRRGATLLGLFLIVLIPLIAAGRLLHGHQPLPLFAVSLLTDAAAVPLSYLAMSVWAGNKIQGLALAKVLNVLTLPPLLLPAIPGQWVWALGLFPTAWGSLIRLQASTPGGALIAALVGVCYTVLLLGLLYRRLLVNTPG